MNSTITGLPAATLPPTGNELIPLDQSGVTKKVSVTDLLYTPRVVAQTGGGNIFIDPTITDLYALTANANFVVRDMPAGVEGQIVVLDVLGASAYTISYSSGYGYFVTAPTVLTPSKVMSMVFKYSNLAGQWLLYSYSEQI